MLLSQFVKTVSIPILILALSLSAVPVRSEQAAITATPQTLYVVPFLNVMIPENVSVNFFDAFIDDLMETGDAYGLKVRILKQGIDTVDREWLAQQYFVTGELFDYQEDSGCCSTGLTAAARIYYYQPGVVAPKTEILVPGDVFFDHDLSNIEKEQYRLGAEMATRLTSRLFAKIFPAL
ncbi:MAG: hypothetical protein C0623_04905 [Desulfuromonas sp.]|nr:MAG: hypothetical protein C0623_04905 [Desulfuromonas sp.]